MAAIARVSAMEILDSRGRPTVRATCALSDGSIATASVPSGASTGSFEAIELRDGEQGRYRGLGCRKAVANISGEINSAVSGRRFTDQSDLDRLLAELDGTHNKRRLGGNAILAVSLAFARADAASRRVPLYQHFAGMVEAVPRKLPRLTINLFSGGKHAGGQVAIQDVLLVPASMRTTDDSLAATFAVYQAAAELASKKYHVRALRADEGGLAPPFADTRSMLSDAIESIRAAGFGPGTDFALAVDVAASHFFADGHYDIDGRRLAPQQMIEQIAAWVEDFPIVSVEDGLAEEQWEHWPELRRRLGSRCLVLGDDLLCTNPQRIGRAIEIHAADALLLKVNQVGTLTEAADALRLARQAGWNITVSARSGETEDNWLADLAVGWNADQIKIGSITQSERLAKYNRLLEIEAETGFPVVKWPQANR